MKIVSDENLNIMDISDVDSELFIASDDMSKVITNTGEVCFEGTYYECLRYVLEYAQIGWDIFNVFQ